MKSERQGLEHQGRPGLRRKAHGEDDRENGETGDNADAGVGNRHRARRARQVLIVFHVSAVGGHQRRAETDGKERLPKGRGNDGAVRKAVKEPMPDRAVGEFHILQTNAQQKVRAARCVAFDERKRQQQQQQYKEGRHQDRHRRLDAAFHAAHDNGDRDDHEQGVVKYHPPRIVEQRTQFRGDLLLRAPRKGAGGEPAKTVAADGGEQIAPDHHHIGEDPARNHRIKGQDNERADHAQP